MLMAKSQSNSISNEIPDVTEPAQNKQQLSFAEGISESVLEAYLKCRNGSIQEVNPQRFRLRKWCTLVTAANKLKNTGENQDIRARGTVRLGFGTENTGSILASLCILLVPTR